MLFRNANDLAISKKIKKAGKDNKFKKTKFSFYIESKYNK